MKKYCLVVLILATSNCFAAQETPESMTDILRSVGQSSTGQAQQATPQEKKMRLVSDPNAATRARGQNQVVSTAAPVSTNQVIPPKGATSKPLAKKASSTPAKKSTGGVQFKGWKK